MHTTTTSQHHNITTYTQHNITLNPGGAFPVDEEKKAFYALGVNVARQVGGELKGILTKDEIAVMLDGFTASMTGTVQFYC